MDLTEINLTPVALFVPREHGVIYRNKTQKDQVVVLQKYTNVNPEGSYVLLNLYYREALGLPVIEILDKNTPIDLGETFTVEDHVTLKNNATIEGQCSVSNALKVFLQATELR